MDECVTSVEDRSEVSSFKSSYQRRKDGDAATRVDRGMS